VRDEVRMRDAMDGCSGVVHLAAIVSVPRSVEDPVGCGSVTHGGTVNVLRQAVEAGAGRFVLASSCAVYGDAAQLPIAETASPRPLSPYAAAKLASEQACADAADAGQIVAACLRFFNVYGPRQDPGSAYSGVISRFISAARSGGPVTIYGDGGQTRDFVYVDDVVAALLAALRRPLSGASVVNVGTGRQTDLLQILRVVESLAGRRLERILEPAREGEVRDSRADAGRARWVLDWEAQTSLDEGLAETWAWFAAAGAEDGAAPSEPRGGSRA
jgi:UDP-glucose 4-epimerase